MDQKELQKTIAEYYQKLPAGAQKVFAEMKWLEELRRISKKYGLENSQIEVLGTETTLVLLGIIHLEEYEENITRELRLSRENTDQLVAEIDESVLRNIRGDLQNSYSRNLSDMTENKTEVEIAPKEEGVKVNIESKITAPIADLPKNVKEAVESSNYKDTLYKIADENDLSIEQMGLLEEAVIESFSGKIPASDFGRIIKQRLELKDDRVNLLVSQINEKILKSVRAKIMGESGKRSVTESNLEMDVKEKAVMESVGFNIEPQKVNKMREFNTNDYKESFMQKAGIKVEKEVVVEPKKEIPENKESVLGQAGIKITPSEVKPNIFASKLEKDSRAGVKETDHSIAKLSNAMNSNTYDKNQDPYRAPIE